MDSLICMECDSGPEARGFEDDAQSGSLWGVSLGTTSKVIAVGQFLVIGCTPTRANSLTMAAPGGPAQWKIVEDAPGVTQMNHDQAMFYAFGQMDDA